ncbi:MAG: AhpC/TSA family protein [Bacteroidales bacterium]|nr:AhpC/TSA family protein [Bacteroidales bacterium]
MKQLLVIATFAFLTISAFSQQDKFTVEVNLKDVPDSALIRLSYFEEGQRYSQEVDKINENTYAGSLSETKPLYLAIHDHTTGRPIKLIRLFISNEDVTISGTLDNYTVTGSETQDVHEKWRRMTEQASTERRKAIGKLYKLDQQGKGDSAYREQLSKRYHHYRKLEDSLTKVFVSNNPNSLTSVFLLDGIKKDFPPDTIRALFKKIPGKYHNNKYGKDLKLFTSIKPLEAGDEWVNFSGFDVEGNEISSKDLQAIQDKFVLLVFSSRGCLPCQQAIPELKEVYKKYNDKLEIVTYAQSMSTEEVAEKVKRMNISWTYLSSETYDKKTMYKYGSHGVPKFVLISPKRQIVYSWDMGYKTGQLTPKVEAWLR